MAAISLPASSLPRLPVCCKQADEVAVVIVPGWFSDASHYTSMAAHLRSRGFSTTVTPVSWYNWIPSLGGRSVRPILDRIDATVALASQGKAAAPPSPYTLVHFLRELLQPEQGAQPELVSQVAAQTKPVRQVVLVAHSAGGWICRILLGTKLPYDGKIQAAAAAGLVKGLITLGTPHMCTDKVTKRNMDFVNNNYPGAAEDGVRYVCIAGSTVRGASDYGGLWKDFAYQSYEMCCGDGEVLGDGVTPIQCAIALEGAEHIVLQGVEHFPASDTNSGRRWYGSPEVVDEWISALLRIATTPP